MLLLVHPILVITLIIRLVHEILDERFSKTLNTCSEMVYMNENDRSVLEMRSGKCKTHPTRDQRRKDKNVLSDVFKITSFIRRLYDGRNAKELGRCIITVLVWNAHKHEWVRRALEDVDQARSI